MNIQLEKIRQVKKEIETELNKPLFIKTKGTEMLVECKEFNVYIKNDYSRVTFYIGETPISEIYPKDFTEVLIILTVLKNHI